MSNVLAATGLAPAAYLLPPQKEEVEPRRATRKKEKICKSFLPESRLNAPFEINPKPDTEPNK